MVPCQTRSSHWYLIRRYRSRGCYIPFGRFGVITPSRIQSNNDLTRSGDFIDRSYLYDLHQKAYTRAIQAGWWDPSWETTPIAKDRLEFCPKTDVILGDFDYPHHVSRIFCAPSLVAQWVSRRETARADTTAYATDLHLNKPGGTALVSILNGKSYSQAPMNTGPDVQLHQVQDTS